MIFPKVLLLFTATFCYWSQGQSSQICSSSSLAKIAVVDNNKSCNLDRNIPKYSINQLNKAVSSCSEIYFCSSLKMQVQRTLFFRNLHSVFLIGVNDTALDCRSNTSIEFTNVTNLKVTNLQFLNCAGRYNMNISYKGNYSYPYRSGIMISNCTNIHFENVTISRSKGTGMSVFNTAGTNVFHKCIFELNGECAPSGTALLLEISNETYQDLRDNIYKIESCSFIGNIAYEDWNVSASPFGRGGGVYINVRHASFNNTIIISDCYFSNNSASKFGGALYAYFFDESASNSLKLNSSIFEKNTSPNGYGGAYIVGFDTQTESDHQCRNNTILIDSCYFQNNKALYGGGLYFTSFRMHNQIDSHSYNKIEHKNCTWMNNSAHYGAAILILPGTWISLEIGTLLSPVFENCTLRSNQLVEYNFEGQLELPFRQSTMGGGILYCSQHNMIFKGFLVMENNTGSGILGSSCSLTFYKDSTATFIGNSGYVGGALQLIGYSTIYVSKGNSFSFHNNTAETDGGAIYHRSSDIIEHANSDNCFISRNEKMDKNLVKFEFSGNLAGAGNGRRGHGNSIYSASLQPCMRESNSVLYEIGNIATKNEVVSEVSSFSTNQSNPSQAILSVIPGKYTQLDFKGHDDLLNERNAVYITTVRNHNNSNVISHDLSTYAINNSIKLLGNPGDTATVCLSTLNKHKTVLSFKVKLEPCPPGYVLQKLENNSNGCVCSSDTDAPYTGISCDFLRFSAGRVRGFWAGYDKQISVNNDSSFMTGYCPSSYCQYHSHHLPRHASRVILNDDVCEKNREGILCSKCKQNTSEYFHSHSRLCSKQDLCHLGLLFYLVSEIIPATILFLAIITMNVSFTSGALNGFLLYAQAILFFEIKINNRIELPGEVKFAYHLIHILLEVFNLNFFHIDEISFCLFESANTLDLIMFRYVTIFYSFFMVLFITLVLRACNFRPIKSFFGCRVYSVQSSMIHGLSAFLILCFAKCAHVSTVVLSYGLIWGRGGKVVKTVVHIYGEYEWLSLDHFKYVIPSLIIGIVIVIIPLVILLFYPLCFKCLSLMKLHDSRCTLFLCKPIEKTKPFLDSFQGCYKDNCRFFAGLYFLYRVLILLNHSLKSKSYFYIILEVQLILMLLIHAVAQPYKERSHNVIDSLLFSNMAIINGISMFIYIQSFQPQGFSKSLYILQEILVLLPLACVVLYYIYLAIRAVAIKCFKLKMKGNNNACEDLLEFSSSRSELPINQPGSFGAYNTFERH